MSSLFPSLHSQTPSSYHRLHQRVNSSRIEEWPEMHPLQPLKPYPSTTADDEDLEEIEAPKLPTGRPMTKRSQKRHLSGWRYGATLAMTGAIFSFLLNLSIVIWISATHGMTHGENATPMPQVFLGDCQKATKISTGVHLLINAISTMLLAGSNYCMQVLTAPTRADIDKSHAKGHSVDVGVPSLANMWRLSGFRKLLWTLLVLSSLPLHLFYNSVFFSEITTNGYQIMYTKPSFNPGSDYNNVKSILTNAWKEVGTVVPSQIDWGAFELLDKKDCIAAYAVDFQTDRRNVVILTTNETKEATLGAPPGVLTFDLYNPTAFDSNLWEPYQWMCTAATAIRVQAMDDRGRDHIPCFTYIDKLKADPSEWTPGDYDTDKCLSEKVPGRCGLYMNPPIAWVVVGCNLVKIVVMAYIAFSKVLKDPLCTVGDAATSFLVDPDPHTQGRCLMSRNDVRLWGRWKIRQEPGLTLTAAAPRLRLLSWKPQKPPRLFSGASRSRWFWTIAFFSICLIISCILLFLGLNSLPAGDKTAAGLARLGLGTPRGRTLINGWAIPYISSKAGQVIAAVLVANSPQLFLSLLYFSINGLCTSMCLTGEWSRFGVSSSQKQKPKTFRVSDPDGRQRGTYFLQLPYRYAIPLMTASGLLHWLISQSIFLAVVSTRSPVGVQTQGGMFSFVTCGFSPFAIVLTISFGGLLTIIIICISLIKLDSSTALVGNSSMAISAACQLPPSMSREQRLRLVQGPVVWGDVGCYEGSIRPVDEALELLEEANDKLRSPSRLAGAQRGQSTESVHQLVHHSTIRHCTFGSAKDETWTDRIRLPTAYTTYM